MTKPISKKISDSIEKKEWKNAYQQLIETNNNQLTSDYEMWDNKKHLVNKMFAELKKYAESKTMIWEIFEQQNGCLDETIFFFHTMDIANDRYLTQRFLSIYRDGDRYMRLEAMCLHKFFELALTNNLYLAKEILEKRISDVFYQDRIKFLYLAFLRNDLYLVRFFMQNSKNDLDPTQPHRDLRMKYMLADPSIQLSEEESALKDKLCCYHTEGSIISNYFVFFTTELGIQKGFDEDYEAKRERSDLLFEQLPENFFRNIKQNDLILIVKNLFTYKAKDLARDIRFLEITKKIFKNYIKFYIENIEYAKKSELLDFIQTNFGNTNVNPDIIIREINENHVSIPENIKKIIIEYVNIFNSFVTDTLTSSIDNNDDDFSQYILQHFDPQTLFFYAIYTDNEKKLITFTKLQIKTAEYILNMAQPDRLDYTTVQNAFEYAITQGNSLSSFVSTVIQTGLIDNKEIVERIFSQSYEAKELNRATSIIMATSQQLSPETINRTFIDACKNGYLPCVKAFLTQNTEHAIKLSQETIEQSFQQAYSTKKFDIIELIIINLSSG